MMQFGNVFSEYFTSFIIKRKPDQSFIKQGCPTVCGKLWKASQFILVVVRKNIKQFGNVFSE